MTKTDKEFTNGKIKVVYDDVEGFEVTFESPQPNVNNRGWVKIWRVADVYVHSVGVEDYKDPNNQVDTFTKGITIEVSFPDNILEDDYFKDKPAKPQKLFLVYFDKKIERWVKFETNSFKVKNKKAVVELYEWIKDPPVGWGGNDFS